jgi:hypothetical protein
VYPQEITILPHRLWSKFANTGDYLIFMPHSGYIRLDDILKVAEDGYGITVHGEHGYPSTDPYWHSIPSILYYPKKEGYDIIV